MRNLKDLEGYTVQASDGEVGSVHDFYFDDDQWAVRYLIVLTSEVLKKGKVLLSPQAVDKIYDDERSVELTVSQENVKKSPVVDTAKPISRKLETEIHDYYQWPYYWQSGGASGIGPRVVSVYPAAADRDQKSNAEEATHPNLRSTSEVLGYNIQARDGEIGFLEDFVIEDEAWRLLYMIVNTGNWLSDRKVLVSPQWIERISWPDSTVEVDLNKETVRHSPVMDPNAPINREYETKLYDHYGRNKYWESSQ
jgi:uncharacterized protein YrrD